MKRAIAVAALALAGLALPLSSLAAETVECRQEQAIYSDRDGAYELKFEAADTEPGASSYLFTVSVNNTDIMLNGFVMPSEPISRSNGILFHDCPEGDTTGEELRKCTVWQGVIYTAGNGKINLLPVTGAPAATEILLPGFALGLAESTAWGKGKATVAPWDVLILKGCQT
jgi:hypothetical protein